MLFEHWIYSTAIAIIAGMGYHRYTGRDRSWIIVASAYAPDVDMIADAVLKKIGLAVLTEGNPVKHGDFHNIAALVVYAMAVALILHPAGIEFVDSFTFASLGFGAHLFEDAVVFNPGYAFLWPISTHRFGLGIFNYSRDWFGIGNEEVLIIGIIAVIICLILRTAYEGKGWIREAINVKRIYETIQYRIGG